MFSIFLEQHVLIPAIEPDKRYFAVTFGPVGPEYPVKI